MIYVFTDLTDDSRLKLFDLIIGKIDDFRRCKEVAFAEHGDGRL